MHLDLTTHNVALTVVQIYRFDALFRFAFHDKLDSWRDTSRPAGFEIETMCKPLSKLSLSSHGGPIASGADLWCPAIPKLCLLRSSTVVSPSAVVLESLERKAWSFPSSRLYARRWSRPHHNGPASQNTKPDASPAQDWHCLT